MKKLKKAQRDKSYNEQEARQLRKNNSDLKSAVVAVKSFDSLPQTLREVVEATCQLWPNRIVFTPRALTSVESANFQKGVSELWHGIYLIAQKLWPLYFEQASQIPQSLEAAFHANSGSWTLTHSEGSSTRQGAKFMKAREDEFEGISLNLEPHLKLSNDPSRLFRIHFHRDDAGRRIIIGHCGNHLDTAGTRRQ